MFLPLAGHLVAQLALTSEPERFYALKPLDVVPTALRIWIQVLECGSIRFSRQVDDQDPEVVVNLASDFLPCWFEECFACIYVYGQTLTAAATVSIDHSGDSFPFRVEGKLAI